MMTIILIVGIITLIAIGLPVAYAIGLVSIGGLLYVNHGVIGLSIFSDIYYTSLNSFVLVAVPLYILMGNILLEGGIGERLFTAGSRILGRYPGGLALATLAGCGLFASMCGSSIATTTTIGTIALPELKKHGYPQLFSTGLVGSGGTLGILIPPSIQMLVFGSMTSVSVGKLFIAGIVPGIVSILIYGCYIYHVGRKLKGTIPAGGDYTMRDKLRALNNSAWGLLTSVIVLGGIYTGFFTPTEAAAVGVAWALLICFCVYRSLTLAGLVRALITTTKTSCMILFILIAAHALGFLFTIAQVPQEFTQLIARMNVATWGFLIGCALLFFVLGMFLDPISVISITIPILYPVILSLGINPVWFAVLMVVNMELANLTPPVGLNVYAVKALDDSLSATDAFRAIVPFAVLDGVIFVVLLVFPSLSLFLPNLMSY